MPYLILAEDRPGMEGQREAIRDLHRAHLAGAGECLLASGAILDDDGETVIGGITLLDTEDRAEAERFARDDPYESAGLRKETKILRWRRRWWAGVFIGNDATPAQSR